MWQFSFPSGMSTFRRLWWFLFGFTAMEVLAPDPVNVAAHVFNLQKSLSRFCPRVNQLWQQALSWRLLTFLHHTTGLNTLWACVEVTAHSERSTWTSASSTLNHGRSKLCTEKLRDCRGRCAAERPKGEDEQTDLHRAQLFSFSVLYLRSLIKYTIKSRWRFTAKSRSLISN